MWNCPVMTAATANRNTISDEASLSKLSLSVMLTSALETSIRRITVVAETASVGETMPPSKKPSASVNPGMSQLEKTPTTHDVTMTMGKAKLTIRRRHRQNSFHETCHAAS